MITFLLFKNYAKSRKTPISLWVLAAAGDMLRRRMAESVHKRPYALLESKSLLGFYSLLIIFGRANITVTWRMILDVSPKINIKKDKKVKVDWIAINLNWSRLKMALVLAISETVINAGLIPALCKKSNRLCSTHKSSWYNP